jgi:hypothetical protein
VLEQPCSTGYCRQWHCLSCRVWPVNAGSDSNPELPAATTPPLQSPVEEVHRPWLVIRGPRHLTLIDSSVNKGNILGYSWHRFQALLTQPQVEPRNHLEAMNSSEKSEWIKAKEWEISNMLAHNLWTEIPSHLDLKTIPLTWAYKCKLGPSNEVTEYKARICTQGFLQT